MAMNYLPIPNEFLEEMSELSDEEYGRLIRWAQTYQLTGNTGDLPGNERFYAKRVRMQVDRYSQKYQDKCDKARESARKRWDANACERMPTDAKQCEAMPSDANDAKPKPKPKPKPKTYNSDELYSKVIAEWNSLGLPQQVEKITPSSQRGKNLSARIKEHGEDAVLKAIARIKNSSFLQGRDGWTVTLDWFVKPNNFTKVLEGNYDDRQKKGYDPCFYGNHSKPSPFVASSFQRLLEEEEEAVRKEEEHGFAV